MSLTSRINGRGVEDLALQDILRSTLPPKDMFATASGKKVFEHGQYTLAAPYALPKRSYSGVVGTAFDYLARAVVARTIDKGKNACFRMLVAEDGLRFVERAYSRPESPVVNKVAATYDRATTVLARYVHRNSDATLEDAIASCCKLARFEYIARNTAVALSPEWLAGALTLILAPEPYPITQDLERLASVFAQAFVTSGIVHGGSRVVFNPRFMAFELGGADADILIDSTLYDFKTSKAAGYKWQDVAQVWGYYLLGEMRGIYEGASLVGDARRCACPIKRLALYKARFGEIEYVDIEKLDLPRTLEAIRRFRQYLEAR